MKAEIKDGGLKLHNPEDFHHDSKLSWLKRFFVSHGKWKYLVCEEFDNVFKYGPDYMVRLNEGISIPFWRDVINALQKLWESDSINDRDWVVHTLMWHSRYFRMHIIPEWNRKGICTVHDFLCSDRGIMS